MAFLVKQNLMLIRDLEIEMGQMEFVFGEIPQKLLNTNFTEQLEGLLIASGSILPSLRSLKKIKIVPNKRLL